MKLFIRVCILLCSALPLYAQQIPKVYNQFFMNPYVYNPAYAGVEGHSVLFFMYKNQWGNIDGAPSYMHANFHVPLKGNVSFGGLVENETEGILNRSSGKISGGYLITLDREHFLRFGLSLGAGNQTLNFGEFDSPNDPAFANLRENSSFMVGDFGATYHFGHFNVGFSLPQLFRPNLITDQSFVSPRFKPTDNVLFKMNYRGHINDDIAIEPHLIYRYNSVLPDQFEATVILHVFHVLWVGGSYRQNAGAVGLLGVKIKEKIGIGYSYETGNPNISGLLGPSHELHIGYHLGSRKKHVDHASSFIKSHRKTAAERAAEAELERQRNLLALQENREDKVAGDDERKPEPWNYEKEDNLVERINENGEKELGVKFDRINEDGEKEVVFSWLPPPPPGVTTETYEIANPNEAPRERTAANGETEIGVKWIRTLDNGETEMLVVWDPVISEEEADKIDHNPSEKLSLENAKIVISAPEITPAEEVEEQIAISDEVKEVVKEEVAVKEEAEDAISDTNQSPRLEEVEEMPSSQEDIVEETIAVTEEQPEEEKLDSRTHDQLANAEDHLEVKRGNHMLELPQGNHLIGGAFNSFDLAEAYSDKLFQRGFHDTRVGYVSERGFYYVVLFQSDNMDVMKRQRNRIKNLSGLSKVWILKVN
ncbi:MAG: type IX secretion system membrane protein PorP/SprF [Cyclobacteriaceae bacterium]